MGNKKFTFKQLLTKQKVEIPVLQRDYVQGNLKDKKAENIREDFVSDLVNHLMCLDPDEMTLDFIYGKNIDDDLSEEEERLEEHLESLLDTVSEYALKSGFEIQKKYKRINEFISKDTFVPFDGQQRLTTLFLLHYLVYAKLGKDLSFLRQFLYKTRESSRDFLKALIDNASDFKQNEVWGSSFIKFIEDRNWFYDFWKYDPTVKSMMVMLETFREKFIQQENLELLINTIYLNLEKTNALTFDFLDIDEHQLDDILYVKMNASGKELTDYEKFKSWLIEYVQENKIDVQEKEWETKLDTVWYDLFWEVDAKKTDELLFMFIKKMLMFKSGSKEIDVIDEEEKQRLQKTKKTIYDTLNGNKPIPFKFYIDHNLINEESLNFVWNNLNKLIETSDYHLYENCIRKVWNNTFIANWKKEQSFSHFLIMNFGNLNLFHQTFLFSVFIYIENLNNNFENFSEDNFFDWIRVTRNLIYNSRIDDTTPFFNAIQSLNKIKDKSYNIHLLLKNEKFVEYFTEQQRKEEFRKNDESFKDWKEDFIEAENHLYFYGQINFIIELSKIENEPNIERFRYFFIQLSRIFSEENLNVKNLISRSLLVVGHNWMPFYGSDRYLFCLSNRANSRDRDENWRRVFNDQYKRELLVELVALYIQYGSLEKIIEYKKETIIDWRRLFLDYPDEINYCKQGLINYQKKGNYIRLLGQSRLSHYHRELRTSILFNQFLKSKLQLKEESYGEMKSDDDCCILVPTNGIIIKVIFDYKALEWRYFEKLEECENQISEEDLKNNHEDFYFLIKSMNCYLSK